MLRKREYQQIVVVLSSHHLPVSLYQDTQLSFHKIHCYRHKDVIMMQNMANGEFD